MLLLVAVLYYLDDVVQVCVLEKQVLLPELELLQRELQRIGK